MIITVPFFAIAFLLLGMHQSSPTEYQFDWSPSRTGYLRRTGIQSDWVTSHDWNWCIPTSRVLETRIFLSSNFKKMRKYRFYWWSYFVYLFMIEVLNDFGLLKRIYVFSSKEDPVTQSGTGTSASLFQTGQQTRSYQSLTDTSICTDEWRSYNDIVRQGGQNYEHLVVNHCYNFIDPQNNEAHTHNVESM